MKKQILADREDIKKIEEEEQFNFVISILTECGLPLQEISDNLTFDSFNTILKIKLRNLCEKYQISIIEYPGESVEIYAEKTLIAKWEKPWIRLIINSTAPNRKKHMYAEINIDYWTVFEGTSQLPPT